RGVGRRAGDHRAARAGGRGASRPRGHVDVRRFPDRRAPAVSPRRTAALAGPPDSTTIEAVLAPAIPLSASDAHLLLDGVRAGAGLLYVAGGGDGLADSLHIARTDAGTFSSGISISSCHDVHTSPGIPLWPRNV